MKVSLLDYGAGNLFSLECALRRLGAETERISSSDALRRAGLLAVPGVGHIGALVRALDTAGTREVLCARIAEGIPVLGICLGMQIFFASSDEAPELRGLGILSGRVAALPPTVKRPHMGWNQITPGASSRLLRGIPDGECFYFAHSFAPPAEAEATAAVCTHGTRFAAAVERGKLFGVQFHPEKSGAAGERVLRNFLEAAQ